MTDAEKALIRLLREHGGHVVHYVPDYSFLVVVPREALAHAKTLPGLSDHYYPRMAEEPFHRSIRLFS